MPHRPGVQQPSAQGDPQLAGPWALESAGRGEEGGNYVNGGGEIEGFGTFTRTIQKRGKEKTAPSV